jgi:hypothetical protein
MIGDVKMQDLAEVMFQNKEDEQHFQRTVGTVEKSTDTISSRWFFRKVFQVCDGVRGKVRSSRDTVRSDTVIPSIWSSP